MGLNTIDDFRGIPTSQSDYQKISFRLNELGYNIGQEILSEKTKLLIISSVIEGTVGDYSSSKENDREIQESIRQDELSNEMKNVTSHSHARDILSQMRI